MARRFGGLWRYHDFVKLWSGQTISMFGSMAGRFALSLVAIIVLKASAGQIALLNACSIVPELAMGLIAGVWVDRLPRRPILICADIGRALVMAWVPLAALFHVLSIVQVYLVTVLISVLTVFFDIAYVSYLPTLIRRDQLVEGNSKLEASAAVAEAGGFGLGGVLVQVLSAPIAVAVDALSFALSALSIALISANEGRGLRRDGAPVEHRMDDRRHMWHEVREGLRTVTDNPVQRAIAGASWTAALFGNMVGVVVMLFFVRDLHLAPGLMGPLFGIGGIAAFFGALAAPRVVRRWGFGRTLIGTLVIDQVGLLCVASATGPIVLVVGLLAAAQLISDSSATIYNINHISLLQSSAPDRLQGRVNATVRFVETTAMLAGLLLGGVLGQTIGLRPTLFVALAGGWLAPLWYIFSPVRALDQHPAEHPVELVPV